MMKFVILFLLPISVVGQRLSKNYVDDRINNLTYLRFVSDTTFEFRLAYDLMGDESIGKYAIKKDTIFLKYIRDTTISGFEYSFQKKTFRADTLFIKGHKLHNVKNGIANKSTYYMIDEEFAKWNKKKSKYKS